MSEYRIIRHNDIHGDAMVFSVFGRGRGEVARLPSEAEAIAEVDRREAADGIRAHEGE